ncbi:GyrI-like domain-containing protein [Romboutsia lituseburensis]|uniref:GyrI-like domain-containing protein n=1 Tax=Romboutsia lituseburensis TaxID=1537 RepID=UPI00215A519B|nr:GyrI-like domain-containing protein [Romboutsia lituseburensis]MCR8743699.1 GyrI-like domain-containing protein [Romboutsia lituseburensis]
MKYEWRKKEKEYYIPKEKPQLVEIPEFKYFTLKGQGNPNTEAFKECIGVLYSLSYAIRMMPKNGINPDGYFEYTVYPLEGIWDLTEEGRLEETLNKDELVYKLMIRQPDFVTEEIVKTAMEIVKKKKPHPLLEKVEFESIKEGLCVQMLHVGPYDDEPRTFSVMKEFCIENNLEIKTLAHKEIYLSDFRKAEASKLKTVLRYLVNYK